MSKFDVYTFQFTPIIQDWTLPFEDIKNRQRQIMENKNQFLEEVLTSDLFIHRSKSLPLNLKFTDDELKVFQIANRKAISIEHRFKKEWQENQPSCWVLIYNNAEVQRIAIEQKTEAFSDTKVVASIMAKAFNSKLKMYNLSIRISKEYFVQEFWRLANEHVEEISKLRFEFCYPNLPRVTRNLDSALENISRLVDSNHSAIEFNAGDEGPLRNITEKNTTIKKLATAAAQGGTPIKLRIKGFRKYFETGNNAKTVEFKEAELVSENMNDIKEILKELQE